MGIRCTLGENGEQAVISIDGRFDFSQQQAFRYAYRDLPSGQMHYVVDMKGVSYVDSAALGMLLLLREHAGGDAAQIRISGCTPDVRRVLDIANFARLFDID